MSKKICKTCKIFFKEENCPICKGNQTATSFNGRINILDANKSLIAKKLGITMKGEYAIKIR